MRNILFVGTLIGITILVVSLIRLRKIAKDIVDDEEYIKDYSLRRKYLILCIIGISITSIMQLLMTVSK